MNIGGGSGAYNNIPMFWEFDNARDFTQMIRDQIFDILRWPHEKYGIRSESWIGVHIEEDIGDDCWDWEFIIHCKNIREFKQYEGLSRGEFESLKLSMKRDKELNNILDV